ncbi:hypothetical protein GL325_06380 [Aeromicrobium sp. 636]|uniref:Uncharacterized protein n=1 Tax=Aeromicrobium senzhongii TaxID=2663859 RepID=A0A8I0K285_9ACTN|nr:MULTISPECIES: hypothetical protein [Aeromicrobium]MBC9225939.1 hypothetical protein [Aeromicrobium senzhongii]MCQ3998046.1 hypothetical protein [Aeromicrobium sp. 636]
MDRDQLAHDMAMAYIHNRYGAEVSGEFSVSSSTDYDSGAVNDVSGKGTVETDRLPEVFEVETTRVKTGERHLFGLGPAKTMEVSTGQYAVDRVFRRMIEDY